MKGGLLVSLRERRGDAISKSLGALRYLPRTDSFLAGYLILSIFENCGYKPNSELLIFENHSCALITTRVNSNNNPTLVST
jgi:hypothetical protein